MIIRNSSDCGKHDIRFIRKNSLCSTTLVAYGKDYVLYACGLMYALRFETIQSTRMCDIRCECILLNAKMPKTRKCKLADASSMAMKWIGIDEGMSEQI